MGRNRHPELKTATLVVLGGCSPGPSGMGRVNIKLIFSSTENTQREIIQHDHQKNMSDSQR
jgi:hypothetical protein